MVRFQALCADFDTIWMKRIEIIEDFFNRVIFVVNQLRSSCKTIEDLNVTSCFLGKYFINLRDKFEWIELIKIIGI